MKKLFRLLRIHQAAPPEYSVDFSGFERLPDDVLGAVFSLLDSKDLATVSRVCKSWHSAAEDDSLWEALLRNEVDKAWPLVLFVETYLRPEVSQRYCLPPAPPPFRKIYKERLSLPNCLIIDVGSGYCKYGLGSQPVPEGKLATFLEFGTVDSPMAPRLSTLYRTIFNRMQLKPSTQPVVISTPICQNDDTDVASAMRRQYREVTFSVLFELGVPAICAVNQAVLALYAAMCISGIVVNIGFHVTSIVPVYNGTVKRNIGIEVIGQGALRLTGFLGELMHQNGTTFSSMYAVRTLKERLCYVAEDYEAELLKDTTASCEVGGEGTFTLKEERFKTSEILFQPRISGIRAMSLHQAVALCMDHCSTLEPTDDGWFKTIVLTGGSACLPGLAGRLEKELRNYLPLGLTDGMTVLSPLHGPYGAWTGAKLLSNMSSFPTTWCVNRKMFRKQGHNVIHAMAFDDPQ